LICPLKSQPHNVKEEDTSLIKFGGLNKEIIGRSTDRVSVDVPSPIPAVSITLCDDIAPAYTLQKTAV
jgi:hypothetical protein